MKEILYFLLIFPLVAIQCVEDKRFIIDSFFGGHASSAGHLGQYNVDKSKISVSGVSSGASFASQMHVIYSKTFMGLGMVSGAPYYCAGVGGTASAAACASLPSLISTTIETAATYEENALGVIDDPNSMKNDRIWIFNGQNDTKMHPDLGLVVQDYYKHFVTNPNNIERVFSVEAQHGQPTLNYGGPCNQLSASNSYLNNCNYSAAYEMLNFIYARQFHNHNLKVPKPAATFTGQLLRFQQSDVFAITSPSLYSLDNVGYLYVPTRCAAKTTSCKLHVVFHGCEMGQESVGETYVRNAGYNEVADLNDIIILYPQAIANSLVNPLGCWDWYGYTGVAYATNRGFQTSAVKRMIDEITG